MDRSGVKAILVILFSLAVLGNLVALFGYPALIVTAVLAAFAALGSIIVLSAGDMINRAPPGAPSRAPYGRRRGLNAVFPREKMAQSVGGMVAHRGARPAVLRSRRSQGHRGMVYGRTMVLARGIMSRARAFERIPTFWHEACGEPGVRSRSDIVSP